MQKLPRVQNLAANFPLTSSFNEIIIIENLRFGLTKWFRAYIFVLVLILFWVIRNNHQMANTYFFKYFANAYSRYLFKMIMQWETIKVCWYHEIFCISTLAFVSSQGTRTLQLPLIVNQLHHCSKLTRLSSTRFTNERSERQEREWY